MYVRHNELKVYLNDICEAEGKRIPKKQNNLVYIIFCQSSKLFVKAQNSPNNDWL